MAIEMLYFAWVREAMGRDGERVDPPTEVATVEALLDWMAASDPASARAFAERGRLRAAVDQEFAEMSTPIAGAREIAIFPPVTGG